MKLWMIVVIELVMPGGTLLALALLARQKYWSRAVDSRSRHSTT